jgi:hypothetical protein
MLQVQCRHEYANDSGSSGNEDGGTNVDRNTFDDSSYTLCTCTGKRRSLKSTIITYFLENTWILNIETWVAKAAMTAMIANLELSIMVLETKSILIQENEYTNIEDQNILF